MSRSWPRPKLSIWSYWYILQCLRRWVCFAQANNNNNNSSPSNNGDQSNGGNIGSTGNANQVTNDQPIGGQPRSGQESSAVTTGDSPWKEFGVFIGPIQKHTGVFHNENGVFIPWAKLCSSAQSYLLESCSSLINPDGSLTSAGDKAVGCITNGAILTIGSKKISRYANWYYREFTQFTCQTYRMQWNSWFKQCSELPWSFNVLYNMQAMRHSEYLCTYLIFYHVWRRYFQVVNEVQFDMIMYIRLCLISSLN